MEEYLRRLVRTAEDLSAAVYSLRTTATMYAGMLQGAVESVHRGGAPYGISPEEVACTTARNLAAVSNRLDHRRGFFAEWIVFYVSGVPPSRP